MGAPPETLLFFSLPLGDFGLLLGLDMEDALARLVTAGLASGRAPSSGNGPKVDPPEAELTPDMADMESPLLLLERTKLC